MLATFIEVQPDGEHKEIYITEIENIPPQDDVIYFKIDKEGQKKSSGPWLVTKVVHNIYWRKFFACISEVHELYIFIGKYASAYFYDRIGRKVSFFSCTYDEIAEEE